MNLKNLMWVEKYRPHKLDDIIGQDINKIKEQLKNPMAMPNYLFYGKACGTGKTSTAKAIRNELNLSSMDFLMCNSSDERKIDFIRGALTQFASSKRSDNNIPKIVLLDELDGMKSDAQDAMRGIMEKYVKNCRFIATANHFEKLIPALKSRFQSIEFKALQKEDILKRLKFICKHESVKYDEIGLNKIINSYYPDMRLMIQELQKLQTVGITEETFKTHMEIENEIFKVLVEKTAKDARKLLIEKNIDAEEFLDFLYTKIDNHSNVEKRKLGIYAIAEINYRMAVGASKDIQLNAMLEKFKDIF